MRSLVKLPRNVKAWGATVVVLALIQTAVAMSFPKGPTLTAWSETVDWALHVVTALVFFHIAWKSSGRTRLFWWLQSACWSMLLLTNTLWLYHGVVLGQEVPELFVGDILLFLAGVPMFAGLMLRPHRQTGDAPFLFIDLPLLVLWWLFLYFFFVTPWQYVVPDVARYGPNYNFVLLAEDMALLGLLTFLWLDSSGKWKRFYGYFMGAQALSAGAAYLANRAMDANAYFPGSWYDVVIDFAIAGFAVTALVGGSLTSLTNPAQGNAHSPGRWTTTIAMLAVFSIPALATWVLLRPASSPEVTRFRVVIALATITLMGCLIVFKQHGLATELERTNRVLHDASLTDPLTGCRNRRYFDSSVGGDVGHALRCFADGRDESRRDLIFYLIDADRFKEINDRFGHDAGDKVLIEMVRRISSAIRLSDVLVRWGGDELLVVSRYTDRNEADILANRLLSVIADRPFAPVDGGEPLDLTCSVGWAAFPWLVSKPDAFTAAEVLGLADRALYEAKQAGRNRAVGMTANGKIVTATACEIPSPKG